MNYNYWDLGNRKHGEIVEITLEGTQANVLLLDSANFSAFKSGRRHRYYGGLAKRSPVRLQVPRSGHWYVVAHFGGAPGRAKLSVQVLPGLLPPIQAMGSPSLVRIRDAADLVAGSAADARPHEPRRKVHDVFISHAREDRESVVSPLATALRGHGVDVWLDESELRIGDNLRRKIDQAITRARFGVVILSPDFFAKGWPNYELDGLVTREVTGGEQVILPIWHNVKQGEVANYSPSLASKLARRTSDSSLEDIAAEIASVVNS